MKKFFAKLGFEMILQTVEKTGAWTEISQEDFFNLLNESKELGVLDELDVLKYKERALR